MQQDPSKVLDKEELGPDQSQTENADLRRAVSERGDISLRPETVRGPDVVCPKAQAERVEVEGPFIEHTEVHVAKLK